ncbi:MAG: hypothetical protein IKP21_05420 [Bacteroidales bacterium]|nr:hypothetical protein [Bacteroidales bacterium]
MIPTSCRKNSDLISNFTLVAESNSDDAKLAVNGASANWVNGETLNINGETKTISVSGTSGSISDVQRASYYRAVYPASIVNGSLNSNNVTVNLPASYQYQVDGSGRQILASPMAAYLADDSVENSTNNILYFKHITGAIVVRITNKQSGTLDNKLVIDNITVTSDNYNISGNVGLNMTNLDNVSPVSGGNSVVMSFDQANLSIAYNASVDIQIPVAAVGDGNHFTIKVGSHFTNSNGNKKYLKFSKTQSAGGALARGQIAYALVTMKNGNDGCVQDLPMDWDDGAYIITTPEEYLSFVEAVNAVESGAHGSVRECNARLGNDINMSGRTVPPINDYRAEFSGANNTISNLHVVNDGTGNNPAYSGMFGYQSNSSFSVMFLNLQNVTVEYTGSDVSSGAYFGGIAANIQGANTTAVQSCTVNGVTFKSSTQTSMKEIGGIVGRVGGNNGSCTLDDNSVTGNVVFDLVSGTANSVGVWHFGGIVSKVDCNAIISDCGFAPNNTIQVGVNTAYFGGLVAWANTDLSISSSSADYNARITGGSGSNCIGGVVGTFYKNGASTNSLNGVTLNGNIYCYYKSNNYFQHGADCKLYGFIRKTGTDGATVIVSNCTTNGFTYTTYGN